MKSFQYTKRRPLTVILLILLEGPWVQIGFVESWMSYMFGDHRAGSHLQQCQHHRGRRPPPQTYSKPWSTRFSGLEVSNPQLLDCYCRSLQRLKRSSLFSATTSSSSIPSTSSSCNWNSYISTHPDGIRALEKVLTNMSEQQQQQQQHQQQTPPPAILETVAFLFVGQAHWDQFDQIVQKASSYFNDGPAAAKAHLVTILSGGVIGEQKELDIPNQPCLSLLTGSLPYGAKLQVSTNPKELLMELDNGESDDDDDDVGDYLLFVDPWSDIQSTIEKLGPSSSVVAGGISCPVSDEDKGTIAYNDKVLPKGSGIAMKLSGNIGLQTVVAQGCRPIGEKIYTITEVQGNGQIITKLDGRPPLEILQDITTKATPEDLALIQQGLLCGISSSSSSSSDNRSQGDYLSRQVAGMIPKIGGLVVGASNLQVGDKFCFQVRDADIAAKDLQAMVGRAKASRLVNGNTRPLAALQISCVARGRGLFGVPNMDVSQVVDMLPGERPAVVGGFFANGEIGPIGLSGGGGRRRRRGQSDSILKPTHLHGFTTVVSIIYEKTGDDGTTTSSNTISPAEDGSNNSLDAWG